MVQRTNDQSRNNGECVSRIFDALNCADGRYENLLEPLREQAAEPSAERTTQVGDADSGLQTLPHAGARVVDLRIPRYTPALPFDGVHGGASEEYRKIRTRILHHPSKPRVFLVSSPCAGDGKTITALNLGGALALNESADVLVIDADFSRGTLEAVTGIPDSPGLGEVLSGKASFEDAIVRALQFRSLYLLSAGRSDTNPAELLDSEVWLGFTATLRKRFGYVVFDSPPIEAVPFYERLLAACDGMLLVARPGHTGRTELNDALQTVPESKFLGVVLNCNPRWFLYRKDQGRYSYYPQG